MAGINDRVQSFLNTWKAQEDVVMGSLNDWIDEEKRLRMVKGEKKHGLLDLTQDPRVFIEEAIEELLDALNYLEFAMLQGKLPFCKWVLIDREIGFIVWRLTGGEGVRGREVILNACT